MKERELTIGLELLNSAVLGGIFDVAVVVVVDDAGSW
jgi:hypothetical protein